MTAARNHPRETTMPAPALVPEPDRILTAAVAHAIVVYGVGNAIGAHISTAAIARLLAVAADEAAVGMPSEPMHLGATYQSRWVR